MAKCRIDIFRLRGTGSMCHMFLLNVEFSNACRFRVFQCYFSTVSRFHSRVFSYPSVDTDEQSTGSCPHFFTKHSKCCDKFFVLTMSLSAFRAYFAIPLLHTDVSVRACTSWWPFLITSKRILLLSTVSYKKYVLSE